MVTIAGITTAQWQADQEPGPELFVPGFVSSRGGRIWGVVLYRDTGPRSGHVRRSKVLRQSPDSIWNRFRYSVDFSSTGSDLDAQWEVDDGATADLRAFGQSPRSPSGPKPQGGNAAVRSSMLMIFRL